MSQDPDFQGPVVVVVVGEIAQCVRDGLWAQSVCSHTCITELCT